MVRDYKAQKKYQKLALVIGSEKVYILKKTTVLCFVIKKKKTIVDTLQKPIDRAMRAKIYYLLLKTLLYLSYLLNPSENLLSAHNNVTSDAASENQQMHYAKTAQRLCFRYMDSTIPLLYISKDSSFYHFR